MRRTPCTCRGASTATALGRRYDDEGRRTDGRAPGVAPQRWDEARRRRRRAYSSSARSSPAPTEHSATTAATCSPCTCAALLRDWPRRAGRRRRCSTVRSPSRGPRRSGRPAVHVDVPRAANTSTPIAAVAIPPRESDSTQRRCQHRRWPPRSRRVPAAARARWTVRPKQMVIPIAASSPKVLW